MDKRVRNHNWILIWVLGIAGQLAWNIENAWFNTYVYEEISPDSNIVTWMVAISAVATTIATFLTGTWSDRLGKRKPFIVYGYILWGLFTIVFGFSGLFNNYLVVAAIMVILADAIMSFFGSVGNDAGFNAWTTDLITDKNKGQIGATIAAQPVLATIIGTLLGGFVVENFGYLAFFLVMGLLVVLIGIYALFTLQEAPTLQPVQTHPSFMKQLLSIFNFKEFIKQKELLCVFVTMSIFFIGFNMFFIHVLNYIIYTLGYSEGVAGLFIGVGLLLAIVTTIPAIFLINKGKSTLIAIIAIVFHSIGLGELYFFAGSKNDLALLLGVIMVGIGYVLVTQTLTVWAKRLYPEERRGQFEGFRIVFLVLIPMIIGPFIVNPLIQQYGLPIIVDGKSGKAPTEIIFLAALLMGAISSIPLYFANYYHHKNNP